ncbi:MAG: hypothetical protein ATN34_01530 [Epulopiscium sp. Nele67-Bin002]|nr:MAG: hypothetical protein BEN18_06795 [Epulopiscium sp. Nuni2H_MBin001]OON90257.1 MAG: hypothetical protein ATN33_03470 [Epulopiscium sp. Nele67-Bin001]OON92318.1 MAG: hypothetical protein ATN34_01530 [Epulopiscium sp. Nele67-Bin002]
MNNKAIYKLEFNKVREMIVPYAVTDEAKDIINRLQPTPIPSEVYRLQNETLDALNMSIKKGKPPINKVLEIQTATKRVQIGAILSAAEILNVGKVLKTSRLLKKYSKEEVQGLTFETLIPYFEVLALYPELEHEISRCILGPNEFSDEATPTLSSIRKQKARLHNQVRETIQNILHGQTYKDMLQEAVVTIREGRYCVPIKVEYKSAFKGIVHDQSQTGATVFMEPASVVEMNNKIRGLMSQEEEEIEVILSKFSDSIAEIIEELNITFEAICKLDVIFAKSEFAIKINARTPNLNERGYVNIKGGRHPLLSPSDVVPIDVYVGGDDFTTLLITGPNTGGKTVTLKTIGLFTIMAQCGLQIPAKEGSELAIFDDVFAGLGDEQSIEQSLSTFSAHMKNIVQILEKMTTNSLVLLDELGSGTDPIEGAALAMSILEHLRKQKICTIATTHYSELKLYALSTNGVENAACEFDIKSLRPTYKLLIGIPGKSNAFAISQKLGFPTHLIEDAKVFLEKENIKMEDILVELEYSKKTAQIEKENALKFRQETETLKEEIKQQRQKLEKSRQKILKRAEDKAQEILRNVEMETEQILKEVRQAARQAQVTIDENALQDVKKKTKDIISGQKELMHKQMGISPNKKKKALQDVKVGEQVLVLTYNQYGTVTTEPNNNGEVIVQMGILPLTVHVSDIERSKPPKEKVTKPIIGAKQSNRMSKAISIRPEVDLRGMMVDEAMTAVDKYLDDAYLSGLKQVTIIHGKGTGVLREAVTNMLRKHPHVVSYRLGKYGEGENGVTIVEIK